MPRPIKEDLEKYYRCPKCGSDNLNVDSEIDEDNDSISWTAYCYDCEYGGELEEFDTRPPPPPTPFISSRGPEFSKKVQALIDEDDRKKGKHMSAPEGAKDLPKNIDVSVQVPLESPESKLRGFHPSNYDHPVMSAQGPPKTKIKVFFCYADVDTDHFRIEEIVQFLEREPEIEKVYYWKRDALHGRSFNEYMGEGIKESNIIVIFCSQNTPKSPGVQRELGMMTAYQKGTTIPIFEDLNNVEETINRGDIRGIRFQRRSFKKFLEALYRSLIAAMKRPEQK